MIPFKNGILSDLAISQRLQAELDKCQLVFLVNTLALATKNMTEYHESQEWFNREIWKLSDKLWPGSNRSQQAGYISDILTRAKNKNLPQEEQK